MGLLSGQKKRGTSASAEQIAAAEPSGGSGRKRLFEGRDGARAQQRSHLCAAENSSRLLSRRWPRLPNLAAQRAIGFTWHTQPARRGRGRESCREQSKSSPKVLCSPLHEASILRLSLLKQSIGRLQDTDSPNDGLVRRSNARTKNI